jgi:hypothetical protein
MYKKANYRSSLKDTGANLMGKNVYKTTSQMLQNHAPVVEKFKHITPS